MPGNPYIKCHAVYVIVDDLVIRDYTAACRFCPKFVYAPGKARRSRMCRMLERQSDCSNIKECINIISSGSHDSFWFIRRIRLETNSPLRWWILTLRLLPHHVERRFAAAEAGMLGQ